jgi:hypothetical protein
LGRSTSLFYSTVNEDVLFKASTSVYGPYLHAYYPDRPSSGTYLGISRINHFKPRPRQDIPGRWIASVSRFGWSVAKYGDQPQVDVNCLSENDRNDLMRQFGIEDALAPSGNNSEQAFRKSDAFRGLCVWVGEHPRLAKQAHRCQSYISWKEMVDEALHREKLV